MKTLNFKDSYNQWANKLIEEENNIDDAMQKAIGAEFISGGKMERDILIQHGLMSNNYLIDIGCGSGRLALPMSKYFTDGQYFGFDVVPDFVKYAKSLVNNPNFRFETVNGFVIKEEDNKADMICAFSIFTHLMYEETYNYFKEVKRVLKSGGKFIFSFLEFKINSHWNVFDYDVKNIGDEKPLNMFLSRDAITAFTNHLDMNVECFYDGDVPHIELTEDIVKEDGTIFTGLGTLGQSICVISKK